MSRGRTMFLFAGVYADLAAAEGDYEVIRLLHSCDEIGYTTRSSSGSRATVRSRSTRARSRRRTVPGSDGAWLGELGRDISRADSDEIGALLEEDRAALVMVGIETDGRIEQSAVEATRSVLKRVDADA